MVAAQRCQRLGAHESLVGNGANLVNQQISFLNEPTLVDQGNSQWKVVLVTPDLCRADHHNGGGVSSPVEQIGLNDQGGSVAFAGFFFVGSWLEIDFPDLSPQDLN